MVSEWRYEDTDVYDDAILSDGAAEPSLRVLQMTADGYQSVELPARGALTIGRSRSSDTRLDDGRVSRLHARVSVSEHLITIADLGSRHGTHVNGERLKPHQVRRLCAGDRLKIGNVRFMVERRHAAGAHLGATQARERFKACVERQLALARTGVGASVAVQAIVLSTAADADRLRDRLIAGLRPEDVVLERGPAMLVLTQRQHAAERPAIDSQFAQWTDRTAHIVGMGTAMYPRDGADAENLIAAACWAAERGRSVDVARRLGQPLPIGTAPAPSMLDAPTAWDPRTRLVFPPVVVDIDSRTVTVDDKEVQCGGLLFDLLVFLVRGEGAVRTVEQIIQSVIGGHGNGPERVRREVWRLRAHLGSRAKVIRTVRGIGYRFDPNACGMDEASARPDASGTKLGDF